MKTLISLSAISLLALSVTACASSTPASSQRAELTMNHCKEHLARYVPNQNKDDATIKKDLACVKVVKG